MIFDSSFLSAEDHALARSILGDRDMLLPDVVLAPDGDPYLYRWHLRYDNATANVFFHIQVKSDPERPLHDHPWDNMSVILSGGYNELFEPSPELVSPDYYERWNPIYRAARKGDTVFRKAKVAHRLILPDDIPYTMTLFTTGPKVRSWGFWYPDGFHDAKRHCDDHPERGGMVSIGRHEQ